MRISRTISCAVMGVLIALPSVASQSDAMARAKDKVTRADVQLTEQDYASAERLCRRAIELEPTLPSAYLGLGAALVGQQRYTEAIEVLAQAERRYFEFDEDRRAAGVLAVEMMDDARHQVETLEETYQVGHMVPTDQGLNRNVVDRWNVDDRPAIPSQAYYLQGIAFLRTGQTVQGIEKLRQCIAIDKSHGLAYYNLAVALLSAGQTDEARLSLDAALAAGVEPHPKLVEDLER